MNDSPSLFSSSSFYGVKRKGNVTVSRKRRYEIKSQIEKRLKRHEELYVPQDYRSRLGGPSSSWKIFFKQKDAFDFIRKTAELDLHLFAFEKQVLGDEKGQRIYLVASYPVFWHYYKQLPTEKKLHYEIIPEGSVCKLYFDLEYLTEFNPCQDGSETVEIFIKYVCYWLKREYHIECDRSNVLDLDASTERKFSRHLIFQLSGAAFRNNIEAGFFVNYIMNKLQTILKNKVDQNSSDSGIDLSIDTSSMENRLLTKQHPDSDEVLVLDGCCQEERRKYLDKSVDEDEIDDELLDINVDDLKSLFVKKSPEDVMFVCDTGVYTKNRNFRLYLSSKLVKRNPLILSKDNVYSRGTVSTCDPDPDEQLFLDSLISNVSFTDDIRILTWDKQKPVERGVGQKNNIDRTVTETIEGSKSSPYPEIDRFIYQQVNGGSKNGFIRHWTYFTAGELLIYDIGRYRWCHNVGRQHKSNNIMYVVDLKKGVYYQKCHDPECKQQGFKSQDEDIPQEILPSRYLEDLFDSDEDILILAAEQAEENLQHFNQSGDITDDELFRCVNELDKHDQC